MFVADLLGAVYPLNLRRALPDQPRRIRRCRADRSIAADRRRHCCDAARRSGDRAPDRHRRTGARSVATGGATRRHGGLPLQPAGAVHRRSRPRSVRAVDAGRSTLLTQRFTAEFSIRPFIEQHPDATLARLRKWTADPSEHVRRLVSEGTRPRLPWAPRLRAFMDDPSPVVALLELLRDDPRSTFADRLRTTSTTSRRITPTWRSTSPAAGGPTRAAGPRCTAPATRPARPPHADQGRRSRCARRVGVHGGVVGEHQDGDRRATRPDDR